MSVNAKGTECSYRKRHFHSKSIACLFFYQCKEIIYKFGVTSPTKNRKESATKKDIRIQYNITQQRNKTAHDAQEINQTLQSTTKSQNLIKSDHMSDLSGNIFDICIVLKFEFQIHNEINILHVDDNNGVLSSPGFAMKYV